MSDPSEQPSTKQPVSLHLIVLMGAVAALLVGAGLYAFLGSSDNGEQVADAGGSCSISDQFRTDLDKAAHGELAAFTVVDDPSDVTDLKFRDANGGDVSIADWKGRTVLLNLWATWCAPCRREMPHLDALEAELGGDKFEVVPISLDTGSTEKPKAFYQEINLKNLPFFHDGTLETLNNLKRKNLAFGLPATLLIDRRGCVVGNLNGPAEWASDDAKALVNVVINRAADS